MSILPIKKQITKIIQTLAYKAYGFNVDYPWYKAEILVKKNQQKVGYKIPIPNIIYKKYSEEGFVYSQPGTTPKQIAEDILVHFKSLNHLQMESDEFGNILAFIKPQYFEQKYENYRTQNKIKCLRINELDYHQKQSIKAIKQNEEDKKMMMILFSNYEDKRNLSQLRQQLIFERIKKIQSELFDRKIEQISIIGSIEKHKQYLSDLQKKMVQDQQLQNFEILYGCERHLIIKKQLQLEKLLQNIKLDKLQRDENENVKLFKFGIVVPQNAYINFKDKEGNILQKQEMEKFTKICLDFPIQKPINLKLIKEVNSEFNSLLQKNILKLPLTAQELFLKINELTSQHKITQLYHLYLLLDNFEKSIQQINKYSDKKTQKFKQIAYITKNHLHQLFFL